MIMGLYATIAIMRCPMCGATITAMGVQTGNVPMLDLVECKSCHEKLKIIKEEAAEGILLKPLVEN